MGINTYNRIRELMEKGDVDATASDVSATAGDFCHMKASRFGVGLLAVQAPLEASFRRHWKRRSGAVLVVGAALRRRSPVRNAVQALEEDCSSRLRVPDACLASFSHRSDIVLAPLMTSFCDILKRW